MLDQDPDRATRLPAGTRHPLSRANVHHSMTPTIDHEQVTLIRSSNWL